MSRIVILPQSSDLVRTVLAELLPRGKDLSRVGVVFQGKRPGHFLRKAIAEELGSGFIPPRVFSMDRFVEYLYSTSLRHHRLPLEALDAVVQLFELRSALALPLGGEGVDRFERFLPFGIRVFHALEELLIEQVSVERLAGAPYHAPGIDHSDLVRVYEAFHRRVEAEGFCTRAMRYATVADQLESLVLDEFEYLIIAGFFAFTRSERRIIKHLKLLPNTALVFSDGPGLQRHVRNIDKEAVFPDPSHSNPSIVLHSAPDLHGQVFSLAQELTAAVASGALLDEQTVIVVPAPEALFPIVEWALPCLGELPHNISLGYPIRRTPIYALLQNVMQVVVSMEGNRVYAPDYIRFILHPYVKNTVWNGSAESMRILAHTIEEYFAKTRALTFLTLQDLEGDRTLCTEAAFRLSHAGFEATADNVADRLRQLHANTLGPLRECTTVGTFARAIGHVLRYLHDTSTAHFHPLFRTFSGTVLERLREIILSQIGRIQCDRPEGYWSVIATCMDETVVPFEGTPVRGVQVLGFLETRNLSFNRVFMVDVNDDVIPGGDSIDPLLPPPFRRSLGLPEQPDHDELAEYWFTSLLAHAQEVHLFFREGGKKEKSRFIERILWNWQQRDLTTQTSPYIQPVEYRVRVTLPKPLPMAKSPAVVASLRRFTYSASALDAYLRCPLRFYYLYVMRLEEHADVTEDIGRDEIGRLVHSVLMEYFGRFVGRVLKPDDLKAEVLEGVLIKRFKEELGDVPGGPRVLLQEQVRRHLVDFLDRYQRPRVQEGEVHIVGLETVLETRRYGVALRGRVDRIELRNKVVHLLDYKTGSSTAPHRVRCDKVRLEDRATWKREVGSLQLPLYALMYAAAKEVSVDHIVPLYVFLGRNTLDPSIEWSPFDDSLSPRERIALVDGVVSGLIAEILDPAISFSSTDDVERDCPVCPFTGLCGTRWTMETRRT